MKRILTLILLFFSLHSFAQNWADAGAKWNYSYSVFFIEGFVELTYEGDTLIQGIEAKKIAKKLNYINLVTNETTYSYLEGYEYMYSDTDRVYQLIDDQFQVLYDFTAQVGDTVLVYNNLIDPTEVGCDSVGGSLVTETGLEMINGENLRWYRLAYLEGSSYYLTGKIIEKIGNIEGYMLSLPSYCIVWEEVRGPLRCYSDDAFGEFVNPNYNEECDFVYEYPVPDYFSNNPEWRLRLTYSGFVTPYDCPASEDIVYYLNGDSIYSNITYKKLYKRGVVSEFAIGEPDPWDPQCNSSFQIDQFVGLIRQDGRQIYFKVNSDEEELLYYNFDLEVGDSLNPVSGGTYMSLPYGNAVIDSIDYLLINNESYKRFYFENNFETHYFIEGIGHQLGLIESPVLIVDIYSEMYCYARNDSIVYTFEEGEEFCDFSISVDEIESINFVFEIYPNPVKDQIQLKIDDNFQLKRIKIYDISGKVGIELGPSECIEVSSLTSGMYLLEVISEEGYRGVKRFVIE